MDSVGTFEAKAQLTRLLERHPDLQFVFTEQGTAWIPETLGTLDFFYSRMGSATGSQPQGPACRTLSGNTVPGVSICGSPRR